MNDDTKKLNEQIALFRYGVIADLTQRETGKPGIGERLKQKAAQTYCIPGTLRTRVAEETIRGWIKMYKQGGFLQLNEKAGKNSPLYADRPYNSLENHLFRYF